MSRRSVFDTPKAYFVYGILIGLFSVFGMSGYLLEFFSTDNQSMNYLNGVLPQMGFISKRKSDNQELAVGNKKTDDDTLAKILEEKVRVLCWVLTQPKHLENKTIHVKTTWGKRCNVLLFFSSVPNQTFPTIGLGVPEGRKYLVQKTMKAFRYVYENHFYDADWFLKADDDTFVIVENLRYFLMDQNATNPVYFGQHFHKYSDKGYNSGGAGYVLSKEALRRLVVDGPEANDCVVRGAEDVRMGDCLAEIGVRVGNTADALGRSRFHAIIPEHVILGQFMAWYENFTSAKGGMESLSHYAITFHYVDPMAMQEMEYFIYHIRPYGIKRGMLNIN
ncbi:glycoprotein-N-acetylgalactosamine 3-beta-galactosyltransferase 1-A isoform X1 [Patella vulgata]|uniref:glycoprotein-N-acetylgalactosamine 3-beta-galactosyltransferase 1-A isoform X1 n=1 Tax=Patella vulgata TaxID=6465 RepID=UPI0021802157|nr:glycoprotein-N-acetylgalactosamine 3-beta-galactosyltransferase 1-A isoform X1 [Patella vulgata]